MFNFRFHEYLNLAKYFRRTCVRFCFVLSVESETGGGDSGGGGNRHMHAYKMNAKIPDGVREMQRSMVDDAVGHDSGIQNTKCIHIPIKEREMERLLVSHIY